MSSLYALLKVCNQLVDRAGRCVYVYMCRYVYIYVDIYVDRYIYVDIYIYIYICIFITLTHVEVLSLLSANRQFNLSTRELLRPNLNKNNQALCNPLVPFLGSYLGTTSINNKLQLD